MFYPLKLCIFKAGSISIDTASGTSPAAVRRYLRCLCFLILTDQKLSADKRINDIPWKDLLVITFSVRVKIQVCSRFRKSLFPQLRLEILCPSIKLTAQMISVLQQLANLPVSPRKDSFQITGFRFMIIERDALDMKLLRQMIMLGAKLFRPVLVFF